MIIHCVLTSWTFIGKDLPPALWFQYYHTISCQIVLRDAELSRTIHLFTMFPLFCLIVVTINVFSAKFQFSDLYVTQNYLFSLSSQPGVKLCLPSDPGGFARAPAAHWPPTRHCELCLWPQSSIDPPDAGLRHPEARTWHPPLRAQRQRALSRLQRLLTGESDIRRLCDSSSQVIDSGVACQPHLCEM